MQYEMATSAPTRQPGDPTHYHPDSIIPTAVAEGIIQWNASPVGRGSPNLEICPEGNCSNPHDDGRTVTINVRAGNCNRAAACLTAPQGRVDQDGNIADGRVLTIEEPGREYVGQGQGQMRYLWATVAEHHRATLEGYQPLHMYVYLPSIVMHEFGHAFGLGDLYLASWLEHMDSSIMQGIPRTAIRSIPAIDVGYVREVYHNHAAQ